MPPRVAMLVSSGGEVDWKLFPKVKENSSIGEEAGIMNAGLGGSAASDASEAETARDSVEVKEQSSSSSVGRSDISGLDEALALLLTIMTCCSLAVLSLESQN
jgi:hypothetical protein